MNIDGVESSFELVEFDKKQEKNGQTHLISTYKNQTANLTVDKGTVLFKGEESTEWQTTITVKKGPDILTLDARGGCGC